MVKHCGEFGVSVWEKHAPKTLKDVHIADNNTRLDLEDYVRFPSLTGNVILEGGYGSGKTTIAKVIAEERLGDTISVIELNGEDWGETTLSELRGTYAWARSNGDTPVVIINEVDRLKEQQYNLRAFLDNSKNTGLVIMTTNHLGNLDGSIVDRSEVFNIRGFTVQECVGIAEPLLAQYGVYLDSTDLETLFARRLVGGETELSLRQIGRVVDRLVLLNTDTDTESKPKGGGLRVV